MSWGGLLGYGYLATVLLAGIYYYRENQHLSEENKWPPLGLVMRSFGWPIHLLSFFLPQD